MRGGTLNRADLERDEGDKRWLPRRQVSDSVRTGKWHIIGQLVRVFLRIAEEVKVAREHRRQQQVKDVVIKELSNSDIN